MNKIEKYEDIIDIIISAIGIIGTVAGMLFIVFRYEALALTFFISVIAMFVIKYVSLLVCGVLCVHEFKKESES